MSLFNVLDISSTGMNAQTIRLNTTASNIANADSVASSVDKTYRARHPIFAVRAQDLAASPISGDSAESGSGVDVLGIVESNAPLQLRYQPDHPAANEQGYVSYPNVNIVEEMANMMSASRSFETNVEVANSAKQMLQRILTLGQ
ncbi:MAG: flagellar basal body rod protein FlgC [Pseudomonadales bacterium]|nr:flagellar basal body rod protein FlgC [Pseudomonadales bacterium]